MAAEFATQSFLGAFCAIAGDLYPELDWEDVEPKLQRSWERYLGDGNRQWEDVRGLVRARWEARSKP